MNKPLILIVEDDEISQVVLVRTIGSNYNTLVTDSSDEAKILLQKNKVDLVLMDISIKGSKNGLEFTEELKSLDEYKHIPIIVVTAHAFEKDRLAAFEHGCNDYISKPFTKDSLLSIIAKHLLDF
ncbi:MAG: response regulator receiver [Ignavibacteria bacterium]|nr:MAG: response regulator receiver [Ignavibacteria bacterium]KAF0161256.1 MAG: response regulator receiver [Ignavibacteria bacterium]